jgi:membrane protease YdiL (CAAX protease family)
MVMNRRSIYVFLAVLLGITWTLQIIAVRSTGGLESGSSMVLMAAGMFLPSVLAAIYLVVFNRSAWRFIQWRLGNPVYLALAVILPLVIALGVTGLAVSSEIATSEYFAVTQEGVEILRGPWLLGSGVQSIPVFILNLLSTAVVYALLASLVTVGEEFGWRGFLQHHLIENFGILRGVGILGLFWGFWHLPINLSGYNYPENATLGAILLFPCLLLAASFIMAWLTILARSFWPAVLMHGTVNSTFDSITSRLNPLPGHSRLEIDLLVLGVMIGVGLICAAWLMARRKPVPA